MSHVAIHCYPAADKLSDIVIELRGGVLVAVYSNGAIGKCTLVDWDEELVSEIARTFEVDSMESMPSETLSVVAHPV